MIPRTHVKSQEHVTRTCLPNAEDTGTGRVVGISDKLGLLNRWPLSSERNSVSKYKMGGIEDTYCQSLASTCTHVLPPPRHTHTHRIVIVTWKVLVIPAGLCLLCSLMSVTVLPMLHVRICWKLLTVCLTHSGPPSEGAHSEGKQDMFISCLQQAIVTDLELKMT